MLSSRVHDLSQGCAPLETVVTLLGTKSLVFKIFKPVAEVDAAETIEALNSALEGGPVAQHVVTQS